MHAVFWITILFMTVVALSFALAPLVREQKRKIAVFLVASLPAFAALAYAAVGSPGVSSATAGTETARLGMQGANRGGSTSVASVSSLAAALESRLAEQRGGGEEWLLLAKSYVFLNRLDEARHAYARAVELGNANDTVAQQVGAESVSSGGITGSVSLSAAAAELVQPDDTVFIFARPPGRAGAPVAVVRKTAEAWPVEFRLTNAQSMTQGVRLSDHGQLVVTARIARRGDADSVRRMLVAQSPPIDVASSAAVRLTIN